MEDSVHEVHARTSNGPITLRIPSDAGAVLRAHTSNGLVHSDFDIRTNDPDSDDVAGTIGRGGPGTGFVDVERSDPAAEKIVRFLQTPGTIRRARHLPF